ncbi:MAG: class I SAM-dependent methyltransferase [Steroidobacteraceae bacterium]
MFEPATALQMLKEQNVDAAMRYTLDGLAETRKERPYRWIRDLAEDRGGRELIELLRQNPYAAWGYRKPRGYAGDAVLYDHMYGLVTLPDDTTELGRAMYDWCRKNSVVFHSVNAHRQRLADAIDSACRQFPESTIVAFACGHMREAELSDCVRAGQANVIAVDPDALNLQVVTSRLGQYGVRTFQGTPSDALQWRLPFRHCSLVYAPNMAHFLPDNMLESLLHAMAQWLRPGGTLLLPSLAPGQEAGYMEAVLELTLRYRQCPQLLRLARGIPATDVSCTQDCDESCYLRIERQV